MKKKCILITLIVTLLMNSIIAIPINSIAAVEDGDFIKEELPYDIAFKEVSVGENHTLAIDSDGNLWAWGYNSKGQLGDETTNSTTCPKLIKKGTKFKEIAAGTSHSIAIDSEGYLWGWGNNTSGQIRTKKVSYDVEQINIPEKLIAGTKFIKVSAGNQHTLAIDESGYLWEWGHDGGYGNGSVAHDEPRKISNKKFTEISTTYNHSIAIDEEGYLWTWGNNDYGQLGDSSKERTTTPQNIKSDTKFIQISAGRYYSMAIDENENLWVWGNNADGQLGNETEITSTIPIRIMRGTKFKQISAGGYHSLAIDKDGNLWSCGYNGYGELGNETTTSSNVLIQIKNGTTFNQIFAGKYHSMAIDKDGILWAWGNNDYGQLGNGEKSAFSEKFVNINEEMRFKQVAAARYHTLAIDSDDNLWTWGENEYGLGDGTTTKSSTPIQIKKGTKFSQISSVDNHSLAIDSEGNLWAWGYNGSGRLGDGTTENKTSPVQIKSGTKFKKVSTSYMHSLAIDSEGNLWAWGYNHDGELGDGTTENKTSPVQIKNGTKFKEISAGYGHSLAIDESGNVWAWGNNAHGQLGNGDKTHRDSSIPVKIESSTKFSQVVAGNSYSLAIDESGNLWAWGNHGFNTTTDSSVPTLVVYSPKFTQISATPDSLYWDQIHNSAIDVNGNLLTWGENKFGQLGNGTTVDNSTPSKVKSNCKMVANSDDATYVIDNEGKLFVCGENKYRLFNTSYYKAPIQITGKINSQQYTVTFKDGDTVLDTQTVTSGGSATAPEAPEKVGHTFTGWDKDFTNVTSNLEVNAKWRVNTYNVTLNPNEGTIPEGENVTSYTYGVGATLPTPTRTGYTFAGWYINQDLTGDAIHTIGTLATGDKTYFAKWEEGTGTAYKVEHYKQNLTTNTYEKVATDDLTAKTGLTVTATPKAYEGYTENQTHEDRVASGVVAADGSLVLKLYYDVNQYTVTFKNENTVLKTETVAHGKAAVAPETPTRAGYTFTGWDKDFSNVTSNLTVKAIWTVSTYKVTLETNGGTIAEGQNVTSYTYGVGATLPTPARVGYTFAGWYKTEDLTGDAITTIGTLATGDKTYYAKWNKNQYTVTFVSDGQTLSTQNIAHGENAIAPTAPTKEGYTFAGWDKDFSNVTSNLTVNAKWTKNQEEPKQVGYKVEHYKQNIKTNTYEKVATDELTGTTGSTVTAVAKTYEGFHENTSHGDRVATGVVVEDGSLVLKLYYDINQYKVTFKDGDKVVKEETVAHGGSATPPTITKPGYILSWDKGTDNITGDTTFTAVWTKDPNYVDPNANDGKEEKPSFLPQTGESYIVVGMISIVMSVAILVYLKYRKISNM